MASRVVSVILACVALACQAPPRAETGESESESGSETNSGSGTDTEGGSICDAGETRCADPNTLETCSSDGLAWESTSCDTAQVCDPCPDPGNCVAACVVACDHPHGSAGCTYFTTGLLQPLLPGGVALSSDAVVVANPDRNHPANVELRWVDPFFGEETLELGPVALAPGEAHVFVLGSGLTSDSGPSETSVFRSGGVYRIVSDYPIVAHLHTPYDSLNSNGSTLLLPEHALGSDYFVANHGAWIEPNYFVVIAVEDDTTLTWNPVVETAGDGMPVPFVDAGATGMMLLDGHDNVRIETSASLGRPRCEQDLSGTRVSADKPIVVLSTIRGLRLPWCGSQMVPGCQTIIDVACDLGSDLAIEQNLPITLWGQQYVGAHSPLRGAELHRWRVHAAAGNVTVTTEPAQPGTPINLANPGDWAEIEVANGINLVFDGDGPFLPVQYVSGHHEAGNGMGSPAMIQAVPTDRFLDRYVFMTGVGYQQHFAQVIRSSGGPDVLIDGTPVDVGSWESVGAWEVANVLVTEGTHEVSSDAPFGLSQYGYEQHVDNNDNSSGYAYIVGLDLE
jgi:hypothetical protein